MGASSHVRHPRAAALVIGRPFGWASGRSGIRRRPVHRSSWFRPGSDAAWIALAVSFLVVLSSPCRGQSRSTGGSQTAVGSRAPGGKDDVPVDRPLAIRLESDSRIWIEGNAGPIPYSCQAWNVEVDGAIHPDPNPVRPTDGRPRATVRRQAADGSDGVGVTLDVGIPVSRIDCGRRGINEDMREALKSDRHPEILYALSEIRLLGEDVGGERRVETLGMLTVAGRSRPVTIPVTGRFDPIRGMRITGSHALDMTDFDIVPPSPMMGLIKVDREMTIRFDVGFQASGWPPSNN